MAVSSSIGSNIFDILMGLPIPWLVAMAYKGRPVLVGADGIGISIGILLFMLVAVIAIIALSGWKLSKRLAIAMMLLYAIFIAQDLARAEWGEVDPSTVTRPICQGCAEDFTCPLK